MINLTIRNIPNEIIDKIKVLSELDKRSLNSEILVLLENSIIKELKIKKVNSMISKSTQIKLWEKLSGSWKDNRSSKKIINDIYENRTIGRDINL